MNTDDQPQPQQEPSRREAGMLPASVESTSVESTPIVPAASRETEAPPAALLPPPDKQRLNNIESNQEAHRMEASWFETPSEPISPASGPPRTALPEPITSDVGGAINYLPADDAAVEQRMRQISRRSFLWGAAALVGGYTAWKGLLRQPQIDGVGWPFRLALEANERLARDYFKTARLAPTFDRAQAEPPKENGHYGLSEDFEPSEWKLKVVGLKAEDEAQATRAFTLADIKKLPPVEMVTQLKCIEGWSVIVQWVGVRFADFVAKYPPALIDDQMPQYVGMTTPDEEYFVGLDMESAMHPQTLLCYEMNGKPLTLEHGAPLRLVIPVKYGIKHIKRIGTIHFSNDRPKDYWAKEGYDWYAGH